MLRIGFLGCGDVAGKRAVTIRALNEKREQPLFEVVAACDLASAKSTAFCARFGGETYSSVGRMLGEAQLDALWICTPPPVRGKAEGAALGAGVALWIEAPIAATIRTANALNLQIKKSGVPVSVCAPHRYCPELERLKRTLSGKNAPAFELWNGVLSANLPRAAWRDDPKNGSVWLDGGWPLLDLLRWMGGEPDKLSGQSNGQNGVAQVGWKNGALASIGVSRFGEAHERLEAHRETDSLSISNWTKEARIELRHERESTIWSGEDALLLQLEAFARLLQSGKRTENRSPFSDALLTLRLALSLR